MTNEILFPVFSIPLYITKVSDWELKKQKIVSNCKLLNRITQKDQTNEFIETDFYINQKNDALDVGKIFSNEIKNFCSAINANKYTVRRSWIERQQTNMYHLVHNHGSLGYSAVCYLEYDSRHHQPLHFVAPFCNFKNGEQIDYCPENIEESSLLIFPSMLLHYTVPNQSKLPRTAVSFNMDLEYV